MKNSSPPTFVRFVISLRPSIVHYAFPAASISSHFLGVKKSGRSYSSL